MLTAQQSQLNTTGTTKNYRVRYATDNALTGNNGQPVPGNTNVNLLPDGSNEVVITLNPGFFQNTTKEWVSTVILHELMHGILFVQKSELVTQEQQHTYMFNNMVPLEIMRSLTELFPGIDTHNAIALGLDGMNEVYTFPGTNTIDPSKDLFTQQNYFQNINQAIATAGNYRNAVTGFGTPFC